MVTLEGQTQMISNIVSVALNRTFLPLCGTSIIPDMFRHHYVKYLESCISITEYNTVISSNYIQRDGITLA